eukprot:1517151-Pyramimonas_sp.AAC.1
MVMFAALSSVTSAAIASTATSSSIPTAAVCYRTHRAPLLGVLTPPPAGESAGALGGARCAQAVRRTLKKRIGSGAG